MPFVERPGRIAAPQVTRMPESAKPEELSFFNDLLPAQFNLENPIISSLANIRDKSAIGDFDPFLTDDDHVKRNPEAFFDVDTEEEFKDVKKRLEFLDEQRRITSQFGVAANLLAGGVAGFFDPTVLIPVGGAVTRGVSTGRRIASLSGRTAAAGLAGLTAQELLLLASQPSRDPVESAINIGVGTVLSAALGAAAGSLAPRAPRKPAPSTAGSDAPPVRTDKEREAEAPRPKPSVQATANEVSGELDEIVSRETKGTIPEERVRQTFEEAEASLKDVPNTPPPKLSKEAKRRRELTLVNEYLASKRPVTKKERKKGAGKSKRGRVEPKITVTRVNDGGFYDEYVLSTDEGPVASFSAHESGEDIHIQNLTTFDKDGNPLYGSSAAMALGQRGQHIILQEVKKQYPGARGVTGMYKAVKDELIPTVIPFEDVRARLAARNAETFEEATQPVVDLVEVDDNVRQITVRFSDKRLRVNLRLSEDGLTLSDFVLDSADGTKRTGAEVKDGLPPDIIRLVNSTVRDNYPGIRAEYDYGVPKRIVGRGADDIEESTEDVVEELTGVLDEEYNGPSSVARDDPDIAEPTNSEPLQKGRAKHPPISEEPEPKESIDLPDIKEPEPPKKVPPKASDEPPEREGSTEPDIRVKNAAGLQHVLKRQDPVLRTIQSPSNATRETTEDLVELPLVLTKHADGVRSEPAVQTNIKRQRGKLIKALRGADAAYSNYRFGRKVFAPTLRSGVRDVFRSTDGLLTRNKFNEAVGMAMRRGDSAADLRIPENAKAHVDAAAKAMRDELFDPLKDRAIEVGIDLKDIDPKQAVSYLTRVYNHQKIISRLPVFRKIITDWFRTMQPEALSALPRQYDKAILLRDEIAGLKNQIDALYARKKGVAPGHKLDYAQRKLRQDIKNLETKIKATSRSLDNLNEKIKENERFGKANQDELDEMAGEVISALLGGPAGRLPYEKISFGPKSPLKERRLNIPDHLIEEFLENDIEHIARIYERTMSPDVELTARFGSVDMHEQITAIVKDFQRKMGEAETEAQRKKLKDKSDSDVRDIAAMRDILRHTYGRPSNPYGLLASTSRFIRNWNYLRLLGGMTLSAIPDVGRSVMIHGIGRTLKDGIVPLVTAFRETRLSMNESVLAGAATDMALDSRIVEIADVLDDYGRYSKFERGVEYATRKLGVVSLMSPWNQVMKEFVGTITQHRTLEAITGIVEGKAVKKAEIERLAHLGIDSGMAKRIYDQFTTHGSKGKVWLASTDKWTDGLARDTYYNMMIKEIDKAIVTPGLDRPLWLSSELGRIVGQFKSFSFASTQRVLMSGLQQRDMAALNGALLLVALGTLSYYTKAQIGGWKTPKTWDQWLVHGFDRSGLTAWFFDAHAIVDKLSRGHVSLYTLTGSPPPEVWATQNFVSALLGPTGGALFEAGGVVGNILSGEFDQSDAKTIKRWLFFQNVFYLKKLFDVAAESTASALGVPK